MNFNRSPFAIEDKDVNELNDQEAYPTIADLMREQKISTDEANTVHRRRDLDSLG